MAINPIPVNVNEVFCFSTEDDSKARDERVPFYPYVFFCRSKNGYPSMLLRIFKLRTAGLIIRYLTVESSIAIIHAQRARLLFHG